MKKGTRNILIGTGIVAVLIAGVLVYGVYSIFTSIGRYMIPRDIPAELKDARVTIGEGQLTRSEFFKISKSSIVKIISDGSSIKDEKERQKMLQSQSAIGIYNFADIQMVGDEIIAAGEFGGYVFDLGGNLKRQIFFEPQALKIKIGPYEQESYENSVDNLRIVRLDKDGYGFLSFGLRQGAIVFDKNGDKIWSAGEEIADLSKLVKDEKQRQADYDTGTYVLDAAVGDLDNDGVAEYVVARKNDGIRAYDRSGTEKWFKAAEFPSGRLEIFDLEGDGKNELIEFGENIRDGNGDVVRPIKKRGDDVILARDDRTGKPQLQFLAIDDGKLICTGENGEVLLNGDAPLSEIKNPAKKLDVPGHPELSDIDDNESVSSPRGVWVKLRKDQPRYLAIVACFIGLPRSNLYIYDHDGKLVYHELLDEDAETLTALPTANGNESLLVGGKETIWNYALN